MKSNKQSGLDVLFIGKTGDPFSIQAAEFLLLHYPSAKIIYGTRQDPFPEELFEWKGDIIISYLSQWILPEKLLENAAIALNFHPGPPEYPGIGCTNFAIYNSADEFGVTCHHMASKVDTGAIISVKLFPVYENDTVYSITQRCYSCILDMFYEIFYLLMKGKKLPSAKETWKRKPYLRKELDELCRLTPQMEITEIERRIKATTYLQPWVFMEVDGKIVKFSAEDIKAKTYLRYLSHSM